MHLPNISRQVSFIDDFQVPQPPPPRLIHLISSQPDQEDPYYPVELIRVDSLPPFSIPLRTRRSFSNSSVLYPIPTYSRRQSSVVDRQDSILERRDSRIIPDIQPIIEEEQPKQIIQQQQKIVKTQKKEKTFKIQKKIKKSELEKQPCNCKNSECLKRYCRCFHSGRQCYSDCQCGSDCKNNDEHQKERGDAIKHVNEKCHRNKNVPKDQLFKLKQSFGCNCKNTHCLKGYCECFLRKQQCTTDCQCENCENGLDEAYMKSQQQKKNYRVRRNK